ncbi:hypothetical protein TrCOL_g8487 [Triparma columacea]|uniref:DUF2997 domain-containing protein n=1 Tax=Triparma columacea TaxID=722753 RepID=A0A9W7G3S7_9STRA|nr:hypothetical protein TrCOL_g8487 [Triparma columacea]
MSTQSRGLSPIFSDSSGGGGKMERLEFTISPTGLVTEKVTGISGPSCKIVTEEINKLLGEVVATEDTAEIFEQELTETNTITDGFEGSTW